MISQSAPRITGTLSEIVANRPDVQTLADAADIPGVNLEFMVTAEFPNGAWFGNYGIHASSTTLRSLPTAYIGQGTAMEGGTLVRYGGAGVGWVVVAKAFQQCSESLPVYAMSSPPTISIGTGTLPGSLAIPATDTRFVYQTEPTFAEENGKTYATGRYATKSATPGDYTAHYTGVEFCTDATMFDISVLGSTAISWRLLIFNASALRWEYVADWAAYASYNNFNIRVTNASQYMRRYKLEQTNGRFAGINLPVIATLQKPQSGFSAMVIGDSYIEGLSFVVEGLRRLGFSKIANAGVGSTGYTNNATTKTIYKDRLAHDLGLVQPDLCVFWGGVNDSAATPAALEAAALATFSEARMVAPNAKFVVYTPATPPSAATAMLERYQSIINAATAAGFPCVDITVADRWLTGTGRVGTTTGDGNCDIYINSTDYTHLSAAGIAYFTERFIRSMLSVA